MDLEDAASRYILNDMTILERVDEYTLYCRYLGFEPMLRTKYRSRIRGGDDSPSFSIFECNKPDRTYMWKDSGGRGESGDIFKLIKLIYGYQNRTEVLQRIDIDFKLGFLSKEPPKGKVIEFVAPENIPAIVRIKAKSFTLAELEYWAQFGIDQPLLNRFRTHSVALYWLAKDQLCASTPAHGFCFAYQVLDRYQIYQPWAPAEKKFRQNLTDKDLHGFHQLEYQDRKLIITKSRKDVMTLAAHGYDAVSPRSENTPIVPEYLSYLEKKYDKIYTLFDNDGKHRADFYPYPVIEIPQSTGCKDPAEFRSRYGAKEFINLIQTLTT